MPTYLPLGADDGDDEAPLRRKYGAMLRVGLPHGDVLDAMEHDGAVENPTAFLDQLVLLQEGWGDEDDDKGGNGGGSVGCGSDEEHVQGASHSEPQPPAPHRSALSSMSAITSCLICVQPFNGGPTNPCPKDRRPVVMICCGESMCMSCAETIRASIRKCSFCNAPFDKIVINRALLRVVAPEDSSNVASEESAQASSQGDGERAKRHKRMEHCGVWGDYVGELNDSEQPHGYGTITWDNNDVYEGEWTGGEIEGQGRYTSLNGNMYEGEFKDAKREGLGTCTYSNGDVYNGEWRNDKKEGHGTHTYADENVYEGEFKGGKKEGCGKVTWADGIVDAGRYQNDNNIGEGARISFDRQLAWRLFDGEEQEEISFDMAASIVASIIDCGRRQAAGY